MKLDVLTLFPQMIQQGLNTSITGRAIEKGLITLNAVNIRDFANNKHSKVDDYPYGGGAGMVMQAAPVYEAYQSVEQQAGRKLRTIYLTPQGKTFHQEMARELAHEEELVFLCGHYEGIDERVLEEIVTDYVSIGDYVLTGGELPAMVMIDAISRLVEGVLNNEDSAEFESFQDNLLEYPQYSRPEEWMGRKVPPVLLSGHHANIEKWRREQSVLRTAKWRPDLLEKAQLTKKEEEMLRGEKEMFEDLGKKLANLGQSVVKKTGEVAEVAALHTKVLGKKKKIEDELQALGKEFYEAHKDETTEFAERITTVNSLYTELAALEEEIKNLKEKLPETSGELADQAADVVQGVVEDLSGAADQAAEAVEEVKEATEEVVEEGAEAVSDAVEAVSDAVETVPDVAETVTDSGEENKEA